MRLIHVQTLSLEEFFGDNIPPYAILSHTWGKDEVSTREWQRHPQRSSHKAGSPKIFLACEQATRDGLKYLWVDTVCIDKTSSAELSEAINSMFAWYRESAVCYAYLADVSDMDSLPLSRWFTRGWTLQELLAPRKMKFFNRDWRFIGKKSDLSAQLASITKIRHVFIIGSPLQRASVAERMSWLSRRKTTRLEDMAYCMLGIFDLNIPLLYGEGTNAFLRLQEEIIRVSNDHTIFCWSWITPHVPKGWRSVIAPSPAVFEHAWEYKADSWIGTPAYAITNAGLSISLPLTHSATDTLASLPVVNTSSATDSEDVYKTIAIPLAYDDSHEVYIRSPYPPHPLRIQSELFAPKRPVMIDARNSPRNAYFKHDPTNIGRQWLRHGVLLVFSHTLGFSAKSKVLTMNGYWDSATGTFWLKNVGRDDFSAGILSIVLDQPDGKRNLRRLTLFFAVHESAPGTIRTSVRKIELGLEDAGSLQDWPLLTRDALEPTIGDSVVMAETHGASWSTSTYSIEAGVGVSINPQLDCLKNSEEPPVSICHIQVGRVSKQPDARGATRRDLHRTQSGVS